MVTIKAEFAGLGYFQSSPDEPPEIGTRHTEIFSDNDIYRLYDRLEEFAARNFYELVRITTIKNGW